MEHTWKRKGNTINNYASSKGVNWHCPGQIDLGEGSKTAAASNSKNGKVHKCMSIL